VSIEMNATDGEMIVTYGLICMSGDVVVWVT
jgi:hypothetical protein